eukprot:1150342-Pelagomonas_calceolata.AAC.1
MPSLLELGWSQQDRASEDLAHCRLRSDFHLAPQAASLPEAPCRSTCQGPVEKETEKLRACCITLNIVTSVKAS